MKQKKGLDPLLHVGVDATALGKIRTGVGNYLHPVLYQLCLDHPDVKFSLFSNKAIHFPKLQNVTFHVSGMAGRGPLWHCIDAYAMLVRVKPQVYWGTNGFLPAIKLRHTATVLTIHDLVYHYAAESMPWYSRLGRRVLQPWSAKQASLLLAVSQATAYAVEAHYSRNVAQVIYPTAGNHFRHVPVEEQQFVLFEHRLPKNFLLFVGTLEPRKNLLPLVKAHARARHDLPSLPPLVVVGQRGWKDAAIHQALHEAIQKGDLHWIKDLDNTQLPALYAACQALILPSDYEGFGMPLLEAQQCGAPVIHGCHPSMSEASAQLGVTTQSSSEALYQTMMELGRGQLPLTCRLVFDPQHKINQVAESMWLQLQSAWKSWPR